MCDTKITYFMEIICPHIQSDSPVAFSHLCPQVQNDVLSNMIQLLTIWCPGTQILLATEWWHPPLLVVWELCSWKSICQLVEHLCSCSCRGVSSVTKCLAFGFQKVLLLASFISSKATDKLVLRVFDNTIVRLGSRRCVVHNLVFTTYYFCLYVIHFDLLASSKAFTIKHLTFFHYQFQWKQ